MSKSLEFCRARASDSTFSKYFDRDWSKAIEVDAVKFFDSHLKGVRECTSTIKLADCNNLTLNIKISFNPDADFQYFTSSSSIHDGTSCFLLEDIKSCVCNVLFGLTYNNKLEVLRTGDTINYVVGNIVALSEYDELGDKFAPVDKPYLNERTTVLIPLITNIERREET